MDIQDGAVEFRISLKGRFAGAPVQEARRIWVEKLAECLSTRFTVDISELTDYDAAGRKLLREMHLHGIHFAASTPASLVLLSEISSPKRWSVTMLPDQQNDRTVPKIRPATLEPDLPATSTPSKAAASAVSLPKTLAAGK
jgi:hypothetical protein